MLDLYPLHHKHMCVCVLPCFSYNRFKRQRRKGGKGGLVPRGGAKVQRSLEAFQDESDRDEGISNCLWKLRDVIDRRQALVDEDVGYPHELP
jgi:hypothetical protein